MSNKSINQSSYDHDVRRCARCGQSAAVCVHVWNNRLLGMPASAVRAEYRVTTEWRCQHCSAKFTLHPAYRNTKGRNDGSVIWKRFKNFLGILFLLILVGFLVGVAPSWQSAVITGILFGILIWLIILGNAFLNRRVFAWTDNPVVPGAAYPEIRFVYGPGNRRCHSCGGTAKVVPTDWVVINGIGGTPFKYTCDQCQKSFETQSIGSIIGSLFSALFFFGILLVAVIKPDETIATRLGMGAVGLIAGGFILVTTVQRLIGIYRNPIITAQRK